MAAERAEILPLLPRFDVFRKKNIFSLDVITFPRGHRGGRAERSKRPGGGVSCFLVFLNQPLLLLVSARLLLKFPSITPWMSRRVFLLLFYMGSLRLPAASWLVLWASVGFEFPVA